MESMSILLDVQASKQNDSFTLGVAVAQVKELAKESRCVIQNYIDKVAESSRKAGWIRKVMTIQLRHEVDSDIDALQHKMSVLRSNMQMFGFLMMLNQGNKSINVGGDQVQEAMGSEGEGKTVLINGVEMIGLEKYVGVVVEELLDNGAQKRVVALCGMGGIGKTTLALAVNQNNDIIKHFDRISWTCVQFQETKDVLENLISGLTLEK